MEQEQKELTGLVERVIYHNEDNGYTVLVLDNDITVTGKFPSISDGESLRLWGDFVNHETYGVQFAAESFEIAPPKDEDDIIRYLGSGAIKGVGPSLARRIVDKFGEDTFSIMGNEPERLAEVKGISLQKAMDISDIVVEKTRDRSAIVYLMKFGFSNALAMRVYRHYGTEIYKIMDQNPYKLAEDIRGVGFKKADEIASVKGVRSDSIFRIKSGIIYLLNQNAIMGHTYVPEELLFRQSMELLKVPEDTVNASLMELSIEKKVAIRGNRVYLMHFYRMEEESASMLYSLNVSFDKDERYIQNFFDRESESHNITLDEKQKKAVYTAAISGVTVITGGPGTGKTTTLKTIIDYFNGLNQVVNLCAPTGRAAKRMSESTGMEAKTIHRLLEVSGKVEDDDPKGSAMFQRGKDYPLEADVIIVDEASMVDITLFYHLLCAIPLETRLVLVGDADQLPSVGPGNVLKDIIESGVFNVVRLDNIFRQTDRSDIVINAHKMQNGEEIILDAKSDDFFFLKRDSANKLLETMLVLIKKKLPGYVDATELDIQVLTPTRKGNLGVESLNKFLQKYLNPKEDGKAEQKFGERIFRVGDKVMQIKNNYQISWRIEGSLSKDLEEGTGVFNGDTGIVTEINHFGKYITVEYEDEKKVEYPFNQMDELEHAFAVTVHKSQGSEYPAVIIPLMNVPRMLMNRNLIYTAITRARKCVVLIGEEEIFRAMVENDTVLKRYSGFKDALLIRG